jgi:tetratricopeptide (TPR) repeat protein
MNDTLAITYLGALLLFLAGVSWSVVRQIFKARKVENTLSQLQAQLQGKGAGTAQNHYELGSIYLKKKIFNQAIAQFQKALKAKQLGDLESLALVHNAMGYTYAAQEQYDLAIRHYKEALNQVPNYVVAWNNLGFAYEKKQLTAQALESYETALSHEPNNKTAHRRTEVLKKRLVQ